MSRLAEVMITMGLFALGAAVPGACAAGDTAETGSDGTTSGTGASAAGGSGATGGTGGSSTGGTGTTGGQTATAGSGGGGAEAGSGGDGGVGGTSPMDAGSDAEPDAGPPPPPPPELVAWYRFENPNDPQVIDSSLYGHHGTPSPTVLRGVGGRYGLGVRFDGGMSNIEVPYSSELDITGDITIEAWVFLDAPVSYNRMLVRKALQYQMSISVIPEPNLLEFYSQPLGFARTTVPIQFAHWVYAATTHDGTTARLYFNGELAHSVPLAGSLPSNGTPLKLGGDGYNQTAPDGGMDEVKVWNIVRSEQEICEDGYGTYDPVGTPKCTFP